ncbi:ATP-binding protein [Halorussus marinus]|uniref:ATP-binding protein n=1 Tax=Halorussus marinus TaxID=2505976 RepID=UPI00106E99E8|nr:ATP-binding protein [Halorussus marinus]
MNKIKLTPTKDAYTAIKADVDENAAVKELIDNSIDNGRRQNRDNVTVKVRYETDSNGTPTLIIEDDSGGLKPEELSMVFALGESEKDDIEGSIGAFGIGAKKALMCLGNEFTIRSRHTDASTGYEYTVGQSWLADSDEWTVPVDEVELESGTTEIEIRDLNFDWTDVRGRLEDDLSQTYELHLRGKTSVTLRLLFPDEETSGLEPLHPPTRPSYSYAPWDGLYPRRYDGIILEPDHVSTPVHMSVEVGLLSTGDGDEAGIDWVCQERVVERANRDAVSGFDEELPQFDLSKHKRLKGRVELYTEGDASEMPWNSDKSRIHARHPVTEAARDVLRKVVKRYMRASYGEVEPAFFEPYTDDSRYAANGGDIAVVDLSETYRRMRQGKITQVQINDKPMKGFPKVTDMQDTASAHAQLGIKYEYLDWVEPWMRPTYHALTEAKRENFGCFDSLEELQSRPPDFTQEGRSGESERKRLSEMARDHINEGVRYTDLAEWERPRYLLELNEASDNRDIDIESLEPVDTLPDGDGEEEEDEESVETTHISFAEFTDDELALLNEHLGEVKEYSPEKRKEVLLDHFRRLNMAGVRFEARAD